MGGGRRNPRHPPVHDLSAKADITGSLPRIHSPGRPRRCTLPAPQVEGRQATRVRIAGTAGGSPGGHAGAHRRHPRWKPRRPRGCASPAPQVEAREAAPVHIAGTAGGSPAGHAGAHRRPPQVEAQKATRVRIAGTAGGSPAGRAGAPCRHRRWKPGRPRGCTLPGTAGGSPSGPAGAHCRHGRRKPGQPRGAHPSASPGIGETAGGATNPPSCRWPNGGESLTAHSARGTCGVEMRPAAPWTTGVEIPGQVVGKPGEVWERGASGENRGSPQALSPGAAGGTDRCGAVSWDGCGTGCTRFPQSLLL